MPIQNLNRNLRQYHADLSKLSANTFLDIVEEISKEPDFQPILQISLNLQFGEVQVTGDINECKNLIKQVDSDDHPHAFNCSIQTNTNPRKTISFNINHAQRLVTIQIQNTDKKIASKIVKLVQDKIPQLEEALPPSPQTPSNTVPTPDSSKSEYLPGAFRPISMPELSDNDVFIIMSFAKEHRDAFHVAIEPVLKKLGFNPIRVDQIQHNATVTPEILRQIERSVFVVADLTGEKPNVYYEVGYAHRADKEVILISKRDTAVHFDVAAINRIIYDDFTELTESLEKRVRATVDRLDLNLAENE